MVGGKTTTFTNYFPNRLHLLTVLLQLKLLLMHSQIMELKVSLNYKKFN